MGAALAGAAFLVGVMDGTDKALNDAQTARMASYCQHEGAIESLCTNIPRANP